MNSNTIEIPKVALSDMALYKNPRKDLKDIKGLAASIVAAGGVTQPMQGFHRETEPGFFKYLVVDGQRRFTSLNLLKEMGEHEELLVNIPFMLIPEDLSPADILARQIISNEGEPLTPLELGEAIGEMINDEKMTVATVSEKLGKSKVYIAELKKLGELPEYIKALIRKGTLSATLVREQMKAGTLDAFIANISENGIEDTNGLPSDDISGEISKETKQKVTQKDLNKLNSIKEFKNFCKAFSEVFANNEEGKIKIQVYEFAKGLINNEFNAEEILAYFTDEKTAQYDTAEKQALRQRANEQTGRTAKGGKTGAGNSDNQANGNEESQSEGTEAEAAEGAANGLEFLERANEFADSPGGVQPEPFPEPVEVASNPIEQIKKAAKVGIQNLSNKGEGKKSIANNLKAVPAKKVAAPKKAVEKTAAPKKAAKKTALKTEPPKNSKRKIGYDKKSGQIAE